jgi:hypothetical protein
MTTAPGVAVVATQLAQTDRRALSQAWYSALHLDRSDVRAAAAPRRATYAVAPGAQRPRAASPSERVPAQASTHGAASNRHAAHANRAAVPLERRRLPTDATRRVERAVERIVHAPHQRTSQTIAIDGGRVTLLVRSEPGATRIVALCSEPVRAGVERALAHARFVLAARGRAVHAS